MTKYMGTLRITYKRFVDLVDVQEKEMREIDLSRGTGQKRFIAFSPRTGKTILADGFDPLQVDPLACTGFLWVRDFYPCCNRPGMRECSTGELVTDWETLGEMECERVREWTVEIPRNRKMRYWTVEFVRHVEDENFADVLKNDHEGRV